MDATTYDELLNIGISKDPVTDAVTIAINSVNELAIETARNLIMDQSKSKSGTSAQSIIAIPIEQKGSLFEFEIRGDMALEFIDKGVNGFDVAQNSPYSFKSANPNTEMAEAIKGWIPNAGVSLPPEFKSYDELSWAIASGVKKKGLKPKPFMDKAFGEDFATLLVAELSEALGFAITAKFSTIADKFNQ